MIALSTGKKDEGGQSEGEREEEEGGGSKEERREEPTVCTTYKQHWALLLFLVLRLHGPDGAQTKS